MFLLDWSVINTGIIYGDTHLGFENKNGKNMLIDYLLDKFCKPDDEVEHCPTESQVVQKSSCQSDIPAAVSESLPTKG